MLGCPLERPNFGESTFHALLGCISANRDVSQCEPQAGTEYLYPNTHLARAPPRRRRASQARLLREGTTHNMGLVDVHAKTKGWVDKQSEREAVTREPTGRDKQQP